MKKYTFIFEWFFTDFREKQLQDLVGFAIITVKHKKAGQDSA